LDFETKQIVTLLDQIPRPYHMEISPDARWVKFTFQEIPGPLYVIQTKKGTNSVDSAQLNSSLIEVGTCLPEKDSPCLGTTWSPDSYSLIWGDAQGIWISTIASGELSLVLNNNITISDPQNQTNEIEVSYRSLEWSPAGRFALLTVAPRSSEVSWQAVLDTRNGKIVQVPDSYRIDASSSSVSWMENGDLLVLHASDPNDQSPPSFDIYRLSPTSNELLLPMKEFKLQEFTSQIDSPSPFTVFHLIWPKLIDSRMMILGANALENGFNPTLFNIDLEFDKYESLYELPQGTRNVLWSPDGQNALVLGADGQILFLSLPARSLRDLGTVLGTQAQDFFWLPPVPRF
jgi:hypothetical protein